MDVLRVTFRPDDEWLGQLKVRASVYGFSAIGEAWFNKDDLRAFAQALAVYPLPKADAPTITGGHGGNGGRIPAQTLVSLKFEPYDARGTIKATIHLETDNWDGQHHDLHNHATLRFLVTYGDLGRFGPALIDLVDGRSDEAVLTSEP